MMGVDALYERASADFEHWEVVKDLVDESIDLALNYRQSGHPGGSRSKVHMLLSLLLSGAMRWDVQRPWRRFGDRFVLSAGHTVPLVYATLAVLNESLRARHERTQDERFAFPDNGRWALTWEWLLKLRRRGGLPGHAEMEGRTLFLKFNTGPSGHGMPPAAGEALALKLAGAGDVKVFVVEGEGGLTPGASHETRHTAWGLGLSNLVFLVDWNDFGIDERPLSSVVYGTPQTWFESYGWRVTGTEQGSEWATVTRAVLEAARGDNPAAVPSAAWFKTRKGRGYGKYDAKSHGTPFPMNAPEFWAVRKEFMAKYGVTYQGVDAPAPADGAERAAQAQANFETAMSVLRRDGTLVDWLSDRLLEIAASVPDEIDGFNLESARGTQLVADKRLFDARAYPAEMWRKPGERQPNRAALATWGSWVNSFARREYGRPLFIGASADLAESTNLAGFGKGFGDQEGWGWYERDSNPRGTVLPTEITEFTNAGMMAGLATVNFAADPFNEFNGFWGTCSTYGSFSYLKYGPLRLFSQLGPGLRAEAGQGAVDRRPRRAGDGGGLAHSLRHLRHRHHAALPGGPRHRPAPVGVQRGAGRAGGRTGHGRAHHRAAPDPSGDRAARPGRAGHSVALRRCTRRLRDARLPPRLDAQWHGLRPGHDLDCQHGQGPAAARRTRPERQGRGVHQPAAVPDAG